MGIGYNTGAQITTGVQNTLIGSLAGDALTDADDNTAVGVGALTTDTLGSKSTAIGRSALQTQNFTTATDTYNTAVGASAGVAITTGRANTLLGASSGASLTGGNDNVLIGYGCNIHGATGANQITIGVGITASGNNNFAFGKASNVVLNDFDTDADWSRSSDERLKTNITNASLGLDFINDLRPVTYRWKTSGDLDANDSQLAHLRREDVAGNIINDMTTDVTMHGLIAQEVKAALDTANVSTFKGWSRDQYGVQHISREMYVIPLIKAVQEQNALIVALTARVATLEG